jgi:hypothetical protein
MGQNDLVAAHFQPELDNIGYEPAIVNHQDFSGHHRLAISAMEN